MFELPKFDIKKEVLLLTTWEYDNQIPISMINMMHKDGWSIIDRDDESGVVVLVR